MTERLKTEKCKCSSVQSKDKKARCKYCKSENVYGISRVVGYFSRLDNWNASKVAEFKDRQKGNYA